MMSAHWHLQMAVKVSLYYLPYSTTLYFLSYSHLVADTVDYSRDIIVNASGDSPTRLTDINEQPIKASADRVEVGEGLYNLSSVTIIIPLSNPKMIFSQVVDESVAHSNDSQTGDEQTNASKRQRSPLDIVYHCLKMLGGSSDSRQLGSQQLETFADYLFFIADISKDLPVGDVTSIITKLGQMLPNALWEEFTRMNTSPISAQKINELHAFLRWKSKAYQAIEAKHCSPKGRRASQSFHSMTPELVEYKKKRLSLTTLKHGGIPPSLLLRKKLTQKIRAKLNALQRSGKSLDCLEGSQDVCCNCSCCLIN